MPGTNRLTAVKDLFVDTKETQGDLSKSDLQLTIMVLYINVISTLYRIACGMFRHFIYNISEAMKVRLMCKFILCDLLFVFSLSTNQNATCKMAKSQVFSVL